MSKFEHYQDLIFELLRKELRVRYKHLALGYVWSIANPLVYAMLYYVVFKMILNVKTPNYPVFLICSLFPWQWLTNSIMVGPMTFYGNAPLIKKTLFPRFLIPLVVVLQEMIHFLASLPVVFVFLIWFHLQLDFGMLWEIPILLTLQFTIAYSLNLLIASLNLFFRDLERILQLGMTFLFYMTPVLYTETMIPQKYQRFIVWHPVAPLIINWRNVLMGHHIDWTLCLSSLIWATALLIIAQSVYRRLVWRFAEVL